MPTSSVRASAGAVAREVAATAVAREVAATAVAREVAVLEFDTRALWRLGDEADLDLARLLPVVFEPPVRV
jgi:hypothetical protein